jgi:hypothetical protein
VLTQWVERSARLLEIAHSGNHVDDRLRGDAWDGGGADVVDPILKPWREYPLEKGTLCLEAVCPLRVVWDEHDRVVRHVLHPALSGMARHELDLRRVRDRCISARDRSSPRCVLRLRRRRLRLRSRSPASCCAPVVRQSAAQTVDFHGLPWTGRHSRERLVNPHG